MHLPTPALLPLLLLLLPTLTLTHTTPPLHTANLHYLLPSSPPKPLATLHYHPLQSHLSTLTSFTPPLNTTTSSDDLVQILFYLPSSPSSSNQGPQQNQQQKHQQQHHRTTTTTISSFHPPAQGRFRLIITKDGELVGASWRAYLPLQALQALQAEKEGAGEGKGKGEFDLVVLGEAPKVVFETGKGGKELGEGGEGGEREKTFLQKYWWLLLGVAVLALTIPGDK